jgi:hypothetical protein
MAARYRTLGRVVSQFDICGPQNFYGIVYVRAERAFNRFKVGF